MKPSKYNILFARDQTHEVILYNTLYGSISVLNSNESKIVQKILEKPGIGDSDFPDIWGTLVSQKNIVDDSIDEMEILQQRKLNGIRDTNRLDLVIIPTLECNFRCIYCYENHIPSKMSEETENKLKLWLSREIPKYKLILVHWYGGEPLLQLQTILSITHYIKNLAKDNRIFLMIHITTNGYLLTEKNRMDLLEIGITDFQITLDGTKETHNVMRRLKNGGDTFDIIFNNIVDLAHSSPSLKITLRVNFNDKNFDEIPKLLNQFPCDIRNQLRVMFEPIFGSSTINATDNLSSVDIANGLSDYYALAKKLGYIVTLGEIGVFPGKLVYCYAERKNQAIINYNGDFFKCSVSKFNRDDRVGYLSDTGDFIKVEENWKKWINCDLFENQCLTCKNLPLCMGGCRRMRILGCGTGADCSLNPTNSSYFLKQIFFEHFEDTLIESIKNVKSNAE